MTAEAVIVSIISTFELVFHSVREALDFADASCSYAISSSIFTTEGTEEDENTEKDKKLEVRVLTAEGAEGTEKR